ncbi:MAG: twin-arginine translocase subunit TatC, partial [Stellaceae bacterium]
MTDADEREVELEAGKMPLLAHIAELRNRLLWSAGAILVGFLICYQFKVQIYGFLVHPLAVAMKGQQDPHL